MHSREINDFLPLLPPKILLLTPSLATTGGRRIHPSLHPQDLNPEDKKAMTFFHQIKRNLHKNRAKSYRKQQPTIDEN